ncbi:MAG TPA: hypothetical protein IGR64_06530 [Leptolyngbyaceae cyanobacterium M65_K2018_010]|nr:hypothetical protein [Leptolyngbyaceae cyanobacterium M65_K2018_010]
MGLSDALQDEAIQAKLVMDCTQLIDEQVAAKGGPSGWVLKATYGVVKGIGPTYIPGAVERLLPEVLTALDPLWQEGLQAGDPVEHLIQNRVRTADSLLGVTDAKIQGTHNGLVKTSYNKLRQSVKGDVEAAVPGLAKLIGAHVPVAP